METSTNGKLFQRTLSKVFPSSIAVSALEVLLLFLLGSIAIVLHAKLKIPLGIPGRHGLEFMAIFAIARLASKYQYAASIAAIGAGSFALIPFLGFTDPFMAIVFFIPGILLDVLFMIFQKNANKMFIVALICGIAYASIPITREIISLTLGIPYHSLMKGFFFPILTHSAFGFAGGLLGASIIKLTNKNQ